MSKERATQLVDAGVWLKLSGDLDGARRLFERALKLDPDNEKARQLLAQPAAELPVPDAAPEPSNPFERGASPSAVERDFGLAVGPVASSPSSIEDDWGRQTGSQSPIPQVAPVVPAVTPPGQGQPPRPPALSSSPSQSTQMFAMPPQVKAVTAPPVASSGSGTLAFAMPPQVKAAAAGPVAASPSGTMAFAMPDEVRAALGDAPPGGTDRYSALPGVSPQSASAEDELRALADEEQTNPSLRVDRQELEKLVPGLGRPGPPVPDAAPAAVPEPAGPSPSRTMVAFAMPPEVKAAMASSQPRASPARPAGTTGAFSMPGEVKAALKGAPAAPAAAPTGTMVFASPGGKAAPVEPAPDAGDDFSRLADEAEEIPLEMRKATAVARLPRGTARGPKPAPVAPAPQSAAPPAPDDWGHLTEDTATSPGGGAFTSAPSDALPPPPAFSSSKSQSTQQFAMPRDVRHASATPPQSQPSGTMQFAMPDQAPAHASSSPSSPSVTMQFPVPEELLRGPPRDQPPGLQPKTISLSGEESPEAPQTVVLKGDAPPPEPPRATPPLFSGPEGGAVVLDGSAPPPSPPSATPPMFSEQAPDPMAAFDPDLLPPPPGLSPKPRDPAQGAWQWKSSSPTQQPSFDEPPVPRPSPSLDPAAQSAWDQRSNPGIKLEAVVGADRALDLISSDSKITRDPAKARHEEVQTILRGARDLLDLDDHTGAMELIDKAEKLAPDSPEVRALKDRSEKTLLAMFESKLGHLEKVPRVLLKDDEIIWLNLDHRAGFVLAQIDGTVCFDDLFAVSGMSRLDTARILAQLVDEGVISRG